MVSFNERSGALIEGFANALEKRGYIGGKTIRYVHASAEGEVAELDNVIRQVVSANVDLIFVSSTPATLRVKQAVEGKGLPVVFASVTDPVASGIVESLRRPGGNITGVRLGGTNAKALDWLLVAAPAATRIYVPHNPDDPGAVQSLHNLQEAAAKLGVELVVQEVRTSQELQAALDSMPQDVSGLFLLGSGFLTQHATMFGRAAIERNLPLGSSCPCDEMGVLVTYAHDPYRMGEQAGRLASKILGGSNPGDIPVESPYYLSTINLLTAQSLGLHVPGEVLLQADRIVRPTHN